jgi:hypothetical protein
MTGTFLTDEELIELTGAKRKSNQIRWLTHVECYFCVFSPSRSHIATAPAIPAKPASQGCAPGIGSDAAAANAPLTPAQVDGSCMRFFGFFVISKYPFCIDHPAM